MNLTEAKQYINSYRDTNPDRLVALGGNFELSDSKLNEVMYVAEQFWLSENISEKNAFEKSLRFYIEQKEEKY